jgi:hypothetical protein
LVGNLPHSFATGDGPQVTTQSEARASDGNVISSVPCDARAIVVLHGTPGAHDASKIYLQQWIIRSHRHPHNLKVVGSNPTPATKISPLDQRSGGLFRCRGAAGPAPKRIARFRHTFVRWPSPGCASAAPGSALKQTSNLDHAGRADRCAAQQQSLWHFWC